MTDSFGVCKQDEQDKVNPGLNESLKSIPSYGGHASSYYKGAFYAYPDNLIELEELSRSINTDAEPAEDLTGQIIPPSTNNASKPVTTVPGTPITREETANSIPRKTEKTSKDDQADGLQLVGLALAALTLLSVWIYRMNRDHKSRMSKKG